MKISVQQDDFDVSAELAALRAAQVGAIVSFVGTVRDVCSDNKIEYLELEHYPGMTEKSLEEIARQARQRWDICDGVIIHRFGRLPVSAQIVLVAVASQHRASAFAACEFMMDSLKVQAPFWKKEIGADGARWVAARLADLGVMRKWN